MTLDDNTRAALHYLGLAAALILVLLGVAWVLSMLSTAGDPSLIPFKRGYLLLPEDAIVVANDPIGMRLAKGFLLACAGAVLLALSGALIAASLGSDPRHWASRCGTWSFAVLLGWSMMAACFLPRRSAYPDPQTVSWFIEDRSVLFGDLTIPFTVSMQAIPFGRIDRIEQEARTTGDHPCEGVDLVVLDLRDSERSETLSLLERDPADCGSKDRGSLLGSALRYLRHKTGLSNDQP